MTYIFTEAQRHNFELISKEVIASVFGSFACVYTGQPLDTIKVRLQAQPTVFSGALQSIKQTIKQEGITSLWKGSTPALSGAVVENMVAFGINKQLKMIWPSNEHTAVFQPIFCGSITGALTAFALCPFDVVKCRLQVNQGSASSKHSSVRSLTSTILQKEGVKGFFRGLRAQVARDALFFGMFFGIYDLALQRTSQFKSVPAEVGYICAGGLSGVLGWVVSMPFDVVKSIMQTLPSQPKSIIAIARPMVAANGFGSLFKGLTISSIRAFPANAALYLGYEVAKRYMD